MDELVGLKPNTIQLDKLTKLELENLQLKINLYKQTIDSCAKQMRDILEKISVQYKINIRDYTIDFDTGTLRLTNEAKISNTEYGV